MSYGTVYFVSGPLADRNPIKIGISDYLKERIRALQKASDVKLELIGCTPGNRLDEALVHRAFCRQHIGGEWFSYSEELHLAALAISKFGFEVTRPILKGLAANGHGIRVQSEAGRQNIINGRRAGVERRAKAREAARRAFTSTPSIHGELQ